MLSYFCNLICEHFGIIPPIHEAKNQPDTNRFFSGNLQHGVLLVVLATHTGQQEVQWVHLVNRVKLLSWLRAAVTAFYVPTAKAVTAIYYI